jgi:hypothetical protein
VNEALLIFLSALENEQKPFLMNLKASFEANKLGKTFFRKGEINYNKFYVLP